MEKTEKVHFDTEEKNECRLNLSSMSILLQFILFSYF